MTNGTYFLQSLSIFGISGLAFSCVGGAEPDPLAVHIFVSRRQYRNTSDTKGGKRHATAARLSWQIACDLGFRGTLGEWERLLGAGLNAGQRSHWIA